MFQVLAPVVTAFWNAIAHAMGSAEPVGTNDVDSVSTDSFGDRVATATDVFDIDLSDGYEIGPGSISHVFLPGPDGYHATDSEIDFEIDAEWLLLCWR